MPLCTVQPPAESSPQMSQHAMFWTLPALDIGQTIPWSLAVTQAQLTGPLAAIIY